MILKFLILPLLILFALSLAYHLMISHRICGPPANFSHTFQKMSEGDVTRKVFLRQGDYPRLECDKINSIIDTFVERLSAAQADCHQLVKLLEEGTENTEVSDLKRDLESKLTSAKERARAVEEDLEFFKLESGD